MTTEQRLISLKVPTRQVDVVLDTDAYNEVDDQFAIAYLLSCPEKLRVKALYAAPFFNPRSESPEDGMEKSYREIHNILKLMDNSTPVLRGSRTYLPDEKTPVLSPAAEDLAKLADEYSPEDPLYVVAIGAITNVASAILLNPAVAENTVVIWLGGHAHHYRHNREFNLRQDIAAARVVMSSGVPFVQLPCRGVVSSFTVSEAELDRWLRGKDPLCTFLCDRVKEEADSYAAGKPWTRIIWDLTAVAWLMNDGDRFMQSRLIPTRLPSYDGFYTDIPDSHLQSYVYNIERDALFCDLVERLTK